MLSRLPKLLIGLLLFSSSRSAFAEEDPPGYPDCNRATTEAESNAAKGAFEAGQASFAEGDYPRAILYLEDAFRRDCNAVLLLENLARAYELNGQYKHATVALVTLIARDPNSPKRDLYQRRVESLKRQADAPKAKDGNGTATNGNAGSSLSEGTNPQDGSATATNNKNLAPLIVAGAGGLVFLVGGGFWLEAQSRLHGYAEQCPEIDGKNQCWRADRLPEHVKDLEDKGNAARLSAIISGTGALTGLAVGAGGLVWYFVARDKPTHSAGLHQVTPTILPGYSGIQLNGRF